MNNRLRVLNKSTDQFFLIDFLLLSLCFVLYFYKWSGPLYWISPVFSVLILGLFLYYYQIKIKLLEVSPMIFLLGISLLSAVLSGGDYYSTKRAIYFFLLVNIYCALVALLLSKRSKEIILSALFITTILVFFELTRHYLFGEGIDSNTDNKNEIGLLVYVVSVLSVWAFISTKNIIYAYLFYTSILLFLLSWSAKFLIPTLLLFFLMFFLKKKYAVYFFSLMIILLFGFLDVHEINSIGNSIFILISKNLALFFDNYHIGRSSASGRLLLISSTIEFYLQGNLLIGQGLESERGVLGTYSHNSFVSILTGTGLLGVLAILTYFLLSLFRIYCKDNSQYKVFYVILLVGMVIIMMAQRFWDSPAFIFLFSFLSAQPFLNNKQME
jgi:hypothetical protein